MTCHCADPAPSLPNQALDRRYCNLYSLEVLDWDPPHGFRMSWHPGTDADEATEVAVAFLVEGEDVRVRLTHTGWERRATDAHESYADGWALVLAELEKAI